MENIKASLTMYFFMIERRVDDNDETDPRLIYGMSWRFVALGYSTKEWVERRKWKQLMKRELNNIDPSLGLINAKEELIHKK